MSETKRVEIVIDENRDCIELNTNRGKIILRLYHNHAPKTCENFERYVREGHYDGTIFHRVIDGFMIQGGGFEVGMHQKPTREPIQNEADNLLQNRPYTIAMARTSDPHSATAQFFINLVYNDFLDFKNAHDHGWGYCVFGEVVKGRDIVNSIRSSNTKRQGMHSDVPVDDIIIESAKFISPNSFQKDEEHSPSH